MGKETNKWSLFLFVIGVVVTSIAVGNTPAEARADRAIIPDDQPDGLLMVSLNSGTERFRFIQISDPHVGGGYGDYGTPGYDDSPPAGDAGIGAQYLRTAVNWINDNYRSFFTKTRAPRSF